MRCVRIVSVAAAVCVIAFGRPCIAIGAPDEAKDLALLEAVRASDAKRVAELLKDGADANAEPRSQGTIFESAIRYGDPAVLRAMAAAGVDFDQELTGLRGWSILQYALLREDASEETIGLLLEKGPGLKGSDWEWFPPCMSRAAMNNPEIMRKLLKAGADANALSSDGAWTCLEFCVHSGCAASVKALLDAGAKAGRKDKHKQGVWHRLAIRYRQGGADEIARALKEKGAGDPNDEDAAGWTPLSLAAYNSATEAVRALVAVGADVNKPGSGGQTPLIQASLTGNAATVRTLIELKADPNLVDDTGTTALYWALSAADPATFSRWLAANKSKKGTREGSVWDQIERADPVGKVKALLAGGADPNRGQGEWSPLALAAYTWDQTAFEMRVGRGMEESSGDTVVMAGTHVATRFFRTHDPMDLVKPLIDAGAVRDRSGKALDALDTAAQRNDLHRGPLVQAIAKVKVREGAEKREEKKKRVPVPQF